MQKSVFVETPQAEDFAKAVGMDEEEMMKMVEVLEGVMNGSGDVSHSIALLAYN